MLKAADYYTRVVQPTVADFCAHNGDLRLAMLASMAALHVVDYVVQNRMPGATKKEAEAADAEVIRITNDLAERHRAFAVVRAFGTASKHARIGMQRKFQPGFDSGRGINRPKAFYGNARFGESFIGDKVGGITVQWSAHGHINLTRALQTLLTILEAEFPELVSAPAAGVEGESTELPDVVE